MLGKLWTSFDETIEMLMFVRPWAVERAVRGSGESEQFSVLSQSELSECRRVVSQTQKYFLTPHHTTPHQAKHLNTKLGQLVNKEFTLFPR